MSPRSGRSHGATGSPGAQPSPRLAWPALALLLAGAAALRLGGLDEPCLWADEVRTARLARLPLPELLQAILERREDGPPAQHLLTSLALTFGDGDAVVRAPSVAAGLLGVAALYALGRQLFGRGVALLSALLLAVSHMHVHYSREARPYALWVLMTVLLVLAFLRAARGGSLRAWAVCGVVAAASYYTHLLSVCTAAALLLAGAGAPRLRNGERSPPAFAGGRALLRGTAVAALVALLLVSPLVPPTLALLQHPMGDSDESFLLPDSAATVALWEDPHRSRFIEAFGPTPVAFAVSAALVLAGFVFAWRRRPLAARAFAWMFLLPVAALSLQPIGHGFAPKYLIHLLPIACLLQAAGLVSLLGRIPVRARAPALAACAALLASAQLASHGERFGPPACDWRGAAVEIERRFPGGGALVLTSGAPNRRPSFDLAPECLGYFLSEDAGAEIVTAGLLGESVVERIVAAPPARPACVLLLDDAGGDLAEVEGVEARPLENLLLLFVSPTPGAGSKELPTDASPGEPSAADWPLTHRASLLLVAAAERARYLPEAAALLQRAVDLMRAGERPPPPGLVHAGLVALERKTCPLDPSMHFRILGAADGVFAALEPLLDAPGAGLRPGSERITGELRRRLGTAQSLLASRALLAGRKSAALRHQARAAALGVAPAPPGPR